MIGRMKPHSRAELLKTIVRGYGLPRYHGKRLVGAAQSDCILYSNQGGTANSLFVPEANFSASGIFY